MISVRTALRGSDYIHHVEVSTDFIPKQALIYKSVGGVLKSSPHPEAGMPVIRVRLFGPRGGGKDFATFTKAQAKELATALLLVAEDIKE